MPDDNLREQGRRESIERRRKVRRGQKQRTNTRRLEEVPVEVERRLFSIRRMSRRRALTRRREDRRSGFDRRLLNADTPVTD